jgi:hypothetical protein
VFDKIPNMEELGLFIQYLHWGSGSWKTVIFDGNHEATKKGYTFFKWLNYLIPDDCYVIDEFTKWEMFDILPYCKLHNWAGDTDKILLTHVRGEIPPHVVPEVDLDIFNGYDIVFAGDLHAHSNSQRNIIYPGSPLSVTFHRTKVKTGVIVFETDDANWEWVEIKVPQLIRKTVEDPSEIIKTEYDHTIYELKGDMLDLSKVKNSDILDKKIVEHTSEATLNLADLSIEEEIETYCSKILNLPQTKIERLIQVYHDNTSNFEME